MEKRDFLYNFTKVFLSNAVMETILIENWEEKDFDLRYIEYVRFFLSMKKNYMNKISDDLLLAKFNSAKMLFVNRFNEKFKAHFMREIMKHCSTETVAENLMPEGVFSSDAINKNALKIFREFEERILRAPKGGM